MTAKRKSATRKRAPSPGGTSTKPAPLTRAQRSALNRALFDEAKKSERDARPEPKVLRAPTDEDLEAVIGAIAEGDTLKGKCRELGVSEGTVRMHISADPQMSTRYAHAKMQQAHAFAEQNILDLEKLDDINTAMDGANVEVSIAKHKFEVRRWTAGKYHVGAYGDKVTQVHEGNPDAPMEMVSRTLTPEENAKRYADRLKKLQEE